MLERYLTILVGPEDRQLLGEIDSGRAPRMDYHLVAGRCQGVTKQWYPSPAALRGPKPARVLRSMAANLGLAARFIKSAPAGSVIYSTGETWGLPVAMAGAMMSQRTHIHVIRVHRLYSPLWLLFLKLFRSCLHVDGWMSVTEFQARLLREAIGQQMVPISAIPHPVDTAFFSRRKANTRTDPPYVLSVGAEMRNYALLCDAARGLPAELIIKASSPWMAQTRRPVISVPENVRLITGYLPYPELRDLYAGASLVVLPVHDTPQAAGVSTANEAMAMEKCIVATRSKGLPDSLIDEDTGIITDPTVGKLSEAMSTLLSQPELARQLGARGCRIVRQELSLEAHALAVEGFIHHVVQHAMGRM